MKKTVFIFAFSVFCLSQLAAQTLSRQVIGSVGSANPQLSYTLGEAVVQTASSGSFTLTQGFHQPEETSVGIDRELAANVDYKLYPNPTRDQLNLELSSDKALDILVSIVDIRGRQVHAPQRMLVQGTALQSFDVSRIAAGYYLLRIMTKQGDSVHTLKFERLD
ncbi:MAG: T9SS type A sorting domain-containing protein [Bacteroidota bacterium]